MLYSLAGSRAAQPPQVIADRRTRYRRPGRTAGQRRKAAADAPSGQTEARVRSRNRGQRWQRIMMLSEQLSAKLSDEARATWLELEELLHAYWLDVSVEHYNRGMEAGGVQSWLKAQLTDPRRQGDKLRAIAAALVEISTQLDDQPPTP